MTDFKKRAEWLKKRAEAVRAAPLLSRAEMAGVLMEEVSAFLIDLGDRVDALTPYRDEDDAA